MSFDFQPFFLFAGEMITYGWVFMAMPAAVVIGFYLVRRIRWRLAHRAGVERRRADRW